MSFHGVSPAIVISIIAVVISLISLWQSHLAPFRLKITNSDPCFRLYKITPEMSGNEQGKTWWIPSIDLGITFHNIGRKAGKVESIRISAELDQTDEKFVLDPRFIVDYNTFNELNQDRFSWINQVVIREWYPILLQGNQEKSVHMVLECLRWENKRTGYLELSLEIMSDEGKDWREVETYGLVIRDEDYENNPSQVATSETTHFKKALEHDGDYKTPDI